MAGTLFFINCNVYTFLFPWLCCGLQLLHSFLFIMSGKTHVVFYFYLYIYLFYPVGRASGALSSYSQAIWLRTVHISCLFVYGRTIKLVSANAARIHLPPDIRIVVPVVHD